jgi:hypothetical protein
MPFWILIMIPNFGSWMIVARVSFSVVTACLTYNCAESQLHNVSGSYIMSNEMSDEPLNEIQDHS